MNISRTFILATTALLLSLLYSCSGRTANTDCGLSTAEADTLTHHAGCLTLIDFRNGVIYARIDNPMSGELSSFIMVHRDSVIPGYLPPNIPIVRTPIEKAAVFSSVHTSAFKELNGLSQIVAIADASYFPEGDTISALVKSGKIIDLGSSDMPSLERLVSSGASVLLRSPDDNGFLYKLPNSVMPIEMVDYLETTPIARAEWLLLLGHLLGCNAKADSIFYKVVDDYSDLALKVKLCGDTRPKVLVETESSGIWYVPAGNSYQATMLSDAGADYPWSSSEGTGSLALSLESVAEMALDADVWLIRSYGYETTPHTLASLNPRYKAFSAWQNGKIYSCNTAQRPVFNDVAFHPERILADYVAIFHPTLLPDYNLRYFTRTGK